MTENLNIKNLRESIGLTQMELADKTGIPRDRIAKWEQGKGKPKMEDYNTLSGFFNKEELPTNESKNNYIGLRRSQKLSSRKKQIPLFDAPAAAGSNYDTDMTPISAPSGTIDVGDLLQDSQAALRVYGNSMIPNYPPGCVVGLMKCYSFFIEPGEVYVIETRDRRLLKRLFYRNDDPDSEFVTCYSDNILNFQGGPRDGRPTYPPFDLPKSEISNLFTVTGVIKRNSNSVIINR